LERIEELAFELSGLKSIVIPPKVSFICGSAFLTVSLCPILVSPDNRRFRTRESFLEDFCGSTICRHFGSCRSVVIPSSVVVLGGGSFCWCESLESVTFENGSGLERIEESAFRRSGLKSIVIPYSVVVLGRSSFYECKSLESVTVENDFLKPRSRILTQHPRGGSRLARIEESAFQGSVLESIDIPSSVVVLGKRSFYRCESLESVTFESGSRLERIEEYAFYESGLKSILVPSSVVVLGKSSFCLCKSLESVTFESGSRLERIEEFAFQWSGLKSILVPSSVVVLGKLGFSGCESLESVTFESGSRLERITESCEFPLGCTAFYGTRLNFRLVADSFARARMREETKPSVTSGNKQTKREDPLKTKSKTKPAVYPW
jgi:hypothetical protein